MWSDGDRLDYLLRVYFGQGDWLRLCIQRAYLDMNRTVRGFAALESRDVVRLEAADAVRKALLELRDNASQTENESRFDGWHRAACNRLRRLYKAHRYDEFSHGQAQKWINMTLKYVYVVGGDLGSDYARFFPYCHVPLDNVVLDALVRQHDFRGLSCPWSKLQYREYIRCQEWVRHRFVDAPLDVEFSLWMGRQVKTRD